MGQEPIQKSNTISCMKNSIQIGNERKDRVWNKTMSKEGEFSYTSEAKNLVGIRKNSSVNVTVSGKSC